MLHFRARPAVAFSRPAVDSVEHQKIADDELPGFYSRLGKPSYTEGAIKMPSNPPALPSTCNWKKKRS